MSIADAVRRRHEPNPSGPCRACHGAGRWETECCNGAYGCSCRGDIVDMGACSVCGGSGIEAEDSDPAANIAMIEGYGFIGSVPSGGGLYDSLPRMGR